MKISKKALSVFMAVLMVMTSLRWLDGAGGGSL